jgi:hypothetical protein
LVERHQTTYLPGFGRKAVNRENEGSPKRLKVFLPQTERKEEFFFTT